MPSRRSSTIADLRQRVVSGDKGSIGHRPPPTAAARLAPEPRPPPITEPRLQGLVFFSILPRCPEEQATDKNDRQQEH
jgi:hypothetical protein